MEVLGWRSDAELVDGVRRGEDFAFGRLFERWFGRVLGVAQDILGDPQAAAEVATDTFHALWYHLDRLDDPEGFGAWAVETSRTFAYQRLASPVDRDQTTPVPTLATAPDAAAAVAVALVARGLPSAAGLGQALQGATGAIASPFGPAAAGAASSAPAPAGFAGAVPSTPPPAGFAGATLPAPPAGFAGGAPGFAGTPGSGSILGGPVGQAADMATQAMPSLGAFDAMDEGAVPRVHRYEPPPRSGLLRSPQVLAGISAAVILVVVGALLLLTRGDDTATAASEPTTLPPAAPSISEPTSASASTEAPTSSATSDPATTSISEGPTTSSTRGTTSTTRATTSSTATTRATTTATSASTTGSTTATTTATSPTTPTTGATTTSSSVTRTTPTSSSTSSSSSSSSSSSTVPQPVIDSFTIVVNADRVCAVGTAERGYTATWSASNATSSALTVGTKAPIRVAAGKGSSTFCAVKGTAVQVAVSGPGGKDSQTKNT